jgi:LPS-assembly protein
VLAGFLVGTSAATGQELPADTSTAPIAASCPDRLLGAVMPPAPDRSGAPIVIYAREMEAGSETEGEASGNVELFRADQHLTTERILFDPVKETVTVPGPLQYEDQQLWLRGAEANYNFLEETGRFSKINYGLTGSSANGSAASAELVGGNTSVLRQLDYTTCPGDEPDWQIYARQLKLLHDEGRGTARGARLEFKGVPILYAPWFSFPIDDRRKSGFLLPSLGHNSDSGFELGIPWYWNIAPNQDATIEPRYYTNRGFMLSSEYRFLTRRTNGTFQGDVLPDDNETGERRYHYLLRHFAAPRQRWRTSLILERVSDDRYFQDFGTNLGQTSKQFLRSSATISGVGRYWRFDLLADDFQVIDESVAPRNEPYRRAPRMTYGVDLPFGNSGLAFGLDSELVYFDRAEGTVGARLDLSPELSWYGHNSWGFLRPRLGYRYTGYDLDLRGAPGNSSPHRGNTIASLDTGLTLDRVTRSGNFQTLRPRLFYLYVPYEKQDDLPLFDTGEFTFGFSQLFNTNRFSGSDRQGDANQLSLAVTTRTFDGVTAAELWSLSLGQIFYFQDQRVQLEGAPTVDRNVSPFLAEFEWRLYSNISAAAGVQWNWDSNELDVGTIGLRYRGPNGRRMAFEYRFRQARVDQFDFRVFWPINDRWRVLSRVNYSFADNDMLEMQAGLEYESCCWAFRTVLRRYLKNRDGDYRDTIYIEFNLKGLASLGTRSQALFPD